LATFTSQKYDHANTDRYYDMVEANDKGSTVTSHYI